MKSVVTEMSSGSSATLDDAKGAFRDSFGRLLTAQVVYLPARSGL
jgi:hypothetical protein